MAKSLQFTRIHTDFKGLMTRAVAEFDRYAGEGAESFRWVFLEDPEMVARCLEFLSEDLPEENLAEVVLKMPYLILMFRKAQIDPEIPVEATLSFLSIINRSGMITIMRQSSDREHLARAFDMEPEQWVPLIFMIGGVPDLDVAHADRAPDHCLFL